MTSLLAILPVWFSACAGETASSESDVGTIVEIPEATALDQYLIVQHAPVDDVTRISSPFGPRLKASDQFRYDFHRGVDFPGSEGDSLYAIADGELYAAYPEGSETYPDGGNVVVLRHEVNPFSFQGETVTQAYAVYLHLQNFGATAQAYLNDGTQADVAAAEVIGTMGQSGDTDFTHLHFETRLQTPCSLEFQLASPDSDCAGYGFDPHVNPIDLFTTNVSEDVTVSLLSADTETIAARVTVGEERLNFNGIVFTVLDPEENDAVLTQTVLDYDHRIGFDASSTASLDEPQREDVLVVPSAFDQDSPAQTTDFTYTVPASVWNGRTRVNVRVMTLTSQGESAALTTELSN